MAVGIGQTAEKHMAAVFNLGGRCAYGNDKPRRERDAGGRTTPMCFAATAT